MNWLAVVAAALALLRSLVEYLRDRKRIDAAVAEALLQSNREALDAIDRARRARAHVRADLERDPARLMQDDGFRRHD
jgi:hypothetical protein